MKHLMLDCAASFNLLTNKYFNKFKTFINILRHFIPCPDSIKKNHNCLTHKRFYYLIKTSFTIKCISRYYSHEKTKYYS